MVRYYWFLTTCILLLLTSVCSTVKLTKGSNRKMGSFALMDVHTPTCCCPYLVISAVTDVSKFICLIACWLSKKTTVAGCQIHRYWNWIGYCLWAWPLIMCVMEWGIYWQHSSMTKQPQQWQDWESTVLIMTLWLGPKGSWIRRNPLILCSLQHTCWSKPNKHTHTHTHTSKLTHVRIGCLPRRVRPISRRWRRPLSKGEGTTCSRREGTQWPLPFPSSIRRFGIWRREK